MRKRDLVDGLVGPRTREAMEQMLCMKGMTNSEKVDFLMSRNRELRAENEKLRVELTDLRLKSCPSCGIKVENEMLRELVRDMWRFTGAACKRYPKLFDQSAQGGQMVMPNMIDSFEQRMAELGVEVEE